MKLVKGKRPSKRGKVIMLHRPKPMRHVEEADLRDDLKALIQLLTEPDGSMLFPSMLSFSEVVAINTLAEVGYVTRPQDEGLALTMKDGSRFHITIEKTQSYEFELEDQIP